MIFLMLERRMKVVRNRKISSKNERGLSMLEYAAAAAVLMTIIYVGLSTFGNGMQTFYNELGQWATNATLPAAANYNNP